MFSFNDYKTKMHVEKIDSLLFRGHPLEMGLKRVFGGQVVGQALNAAYRTVEPERKPHSLHGYFLRPGELSKPIIYEVDPIRDGRSFTTRRVVGKQNGEAIFNASISFQLIEDGVSHQMDLPLDVPMPDTLLSDIEQAEHLAKTMDGVSVEMFRSFTLMFEKEVVDLRTPTLHQLVTPGHYPPHYGFWFKFIFRTSRHIKHGRFADYRHYMGDYLHSFRHAKPDDVVWKVSKYRKIVSLHDKNVIKNPYLFRKDTDAL